MTEKDLIRELPKGLIKWINFKSDTNAVIITNGSELDEVLFEALKENDINAELIENPDDILNEKIGYYDYIIISSVLEKNKAERSTDKFLENIKKIIRPDGRLFVCTENRLGIRYFCGDKDPYTGRNFDGIEDYKRIQVNTGEISGKLFSKSELIEVLEEAGFLYHKFYSVFPEILSPQILISEDFYPNEELNIRIFPHYNSPDTVFLEEENLYNSLIKNKMFHSMANGFLIECALEQKDQKDYELANQITISMSRGKENALCTIVKDNGTVEKKAIYKEGLIKLLKLEENSNYLEKQGINIVKGHINFNSYTMPYVKGISLATYLRELMRNNKNEFYSNMDILWDNIINSSELVIDKKTELGKVLKRGYIDLVLVNGLKTEKGFVYFDQEEYIENLPAGAIMIRNIDFLYHGDIELEYFISREELYKRYGLFENRKDYHFIVNNFLMKLRNDDILYKYYQSRRRNSEIIHSNRQRLNYSTKEYLRLFVNIFNNLENKKIYLFGSGNFTRKFLALYKDEYVISGIIDNDKTKWGMYLEGIEINSPDILENIDSSTYKVIICIKNYVGVLSQVKKIGATNIGIYDTNIEYPRPPIRIKSELKEDISKINEKKKYHVGYIAGVFDLFHIGHLNLLRRAKENCDYLIVGVVTDEGVIKNKKTNPYVPFEERLAIIQSCCFVDEALGIPLEYCDTKDAYLKFQFDVQFSGSDYSNDPYWKDKKEFLNRQGSDLVYFPYTETTSSTKLKALIDKNLI